MPLTTSLQLYSVHRQLDADLDGTLARIAAIGIRHVEAFDFVERAGALAEAFARHGISAATGHAMLLQSEFTFDGVTKPVPTHAVTFAAARELGMSYVIDPAAFDWSTREAIAEHARRLNAAAAVGADYGVRVGYHNHGWEMDQVDGVIGLELLADLLEPEVALEVDLYWAYIGGVDVPALIESLGDRVKALHVKDGPTVANPFRSGMNVDVVALGQTPAGQGEVPLEASLRAARSAEYAVIEFDHFSGDIFDGIQASYEFLETRA